MSLGRPDDAIAQFNQSLARNPKDADALYQLGRLHMNGSLEAIQKLTDLDPDSFQLHALIGEVYANNNRYEDSLKEYQAALGQTSECSRHPLCPGRRVSKSETNRCRRKGISWLLCVKIHTTSE